MKSKLTPQRIAEINRVVKERFGKSPTSLFRCWCDDVIAKLKTSPDRSVFDAILSNEFATPDCEEWRKKHDISMKDIEDELLVANEEINAVNKLIQPLNDIKLRWLREWFASNNDVVADKVSVQATAKDDATLLDFMILDNAEQKQKLLDVLHKLLDKKKGKHVALVLLVCVNRGLMRKPTHKILQSTFGVIGTKSGYNNYYSKGLSAYTQEEIKGIETHISPFVNGH